MARRSVLLASLVAMVVLLLALPAAAAESLEVQPAGCNEAKVAGSGLPASTALTVVVSDGFSGKALGQVAVTTDADGSFSTRLPVSLRGLAAVGAEARDGERILLGATHNLDSALRSQCGGTSAGASSALPFTGPTQAYLLLAIGAGLLGVGGLTRASFAYRGRH